MPRWPGRHRFWKEIPNRALVNLLLAVGLTFASMGFLGDIVSLDTQPFSSALYRAAIAGLTAATVLAALARDYRWLILTAVVQTGGTVFMQRLAHHPPWAHFTSLTTQQRLQLDSAGGLVAVLAGYNAFLIFIGSEGRRQVAVSAELELAHRIHQTLVPAIDDTIGAASFHGLSQPSGQVGGDLVDVIPLPGGEWLAYVADVSGHGVSSGLIMGMVKSAMRMGVLDHSALTDLVSRLNQLMCSQLAPSMYVTLGAIRSAGPAQIEVLIAGHPPLLRVSRNHDHATVEAVSANHVPIGFAPDWTFTSSVVPFHSGDLLVLLTDGLFEVFNSKDQDLGLDEIKQVLVAAHRLPLREIAGRVFHRARTFGPQLDDQTILLISAGDPGASS